MQRSLDELLKLPDEALVTDDEAAAVLRCATQSLANRRHKRLPPGYVRVGASIRYEMGVLRAFRAHGRVDHSGPRAA